MTATDQFASGPHPDSFVVPEVCHYCGERKMVSHWVPPMAGNITGKTQICRSCAGQPEPSDETSSDGAPREYLVVITVRIPVEAQNQPQAEDRGEEVANCIIVPASMEWAGDYEV